MSIDKTDGNSSPMTFDDDDVVVVSLKAKELQQDSSLDPTGEKLAGGQNAQNYQKN